MEAEDYSLGVRFQGLLLNEQVLALCRIVEGRGSEAIRAKDVADLFEDIGLPLPSNVSDIFKTLKLRGQLTPTRTRGAWRLTPKGKEDSLKQFSQSGLNQLLAENATQSLATLGNQAHPLLPPSLAPAGITNDVRDFVSKYPFDSNIFAMTRFPEETIPSDPVLHTIDTVRNVVQSYSLNLHTASDRAIVDDLWGNVMAHIWASRYGVAILEDRAERGVNLNMSIEVGAMLTLGRRCMLLKDVSVDRIPTDLIGKIYKPVDLSKPETVRTATESWLADDLRIPTPV